MKKEIYILCCIVLFLSCNEKRTKEIWFAERGMFSPPTYVCYKSAEKITIDGILSPEEWDKIPWTADFIDIEGDIQPIPYLQTGIKITHDDEGIYFGALMEEPHVWSVLMQHDTMVFYDNCLEIFLNPSNDTHNYFEYQINPLGTEWDLLLSKPYRDKGVALSGWEFSGMKSAVHIDGTINNPNDIDKSWSVEIFIPWKSIYEVTSSAKPSEGDQMRANFSRVHWNSEIKDNRYYKAPFEGEEKIREQYWTWAPMGAINLHMPEYWGYLQFTEKTAENDVAFVWKQEEDIKWMLRQLYYRQREYHQAFNEYSCNLANLKPEEILPPETIKQLSIETTPTMYEITLTNKENNTIWHIRQDGFIWDSTIRTNEGDFSNR